MFSGVDLRPAGDQDVVRLLRAGDRHHRHALHGGGRAQHPLPAGESREPLRQLQRPGGALPQPQGRLPGAHRLPPHIHRRGTLGLTELHRYV